MKAKYDITYKEDELIIEIKPNHSNMIKFGIWFFYIIPLAVPLCLMIYLLLFRILDNEFDFSVYSIGIPVLGLLLVNVAFNKLYKKEIIKITQDEFIIIDKKVLGESSNEFQKKDIQNFKVAEKEGFTNHPNKTNGPDYLGFESSEKEVQFFTEGGTISFDYPGGQIRFGNGLDRYTALTLIDRINANWN